MKEKNESLIWQPEGEGGHAGERKRWGESEILTINAKVLN